MKHLRNHSYLAPILERTFFSNSSFLSKFNPRNIRHIIDIPRIKFFAQRSNRENWRFSFGHYLAILLLLFLFLFSIGEAEARPKYFFKVASLAPGGSVWVTKFEKFAQEISEKTGGEIGFRVYPGGIMGDDTAMYRKMRVGQLQGGGFTMTGISEVIPDFRVMALPFLFRSYDEVDSVRNGLLPLFKQRFSEKGIEFIAMTEVGFIYTMSTRPTVTTAELKKSKSWIPSGDPIATEFFATLGVSPIPLSIPDVLTGLQTGMVNTVYNSLYGSIIMQWFPKARFITDVPYAYAYGVFALDKKKFNKMPDRYQTLIHETAEKHFDLLIEDTRKSNQDSRKVLQEHGVTFLNSPQKEIEELHKYRNHAVERMIGNSFSKEIYNKTIELLEDHRANIPSTSGK